MVCDESTCVFKIKVKDNVFSLLCVRYSVIIQDVGSAPILYVSETQRRCWKSIPSQQKF